MPVPAVTSPHADVTSFPAGSNLVQTRSAAFTAEGTAATDYAGPETSIETSSELMHHAPQTVSEAHGLLAQQSALHFLPSWQSPTPIAARNSPIPYRPSETGDAPAPACKSFTSPVFPGAGPTLGGSGMGSVALGGMGSDDSLSGGFAFMPPAALFPPKAPSPAAVPAPAGPGGTAEPGAPAGCQQAQEARPMGLSVGDSMGPIAAMDAPPNAAQQ